MAAEGKMGSGPSTAGGSTAIGIPAPGALAEEAPAGVTSKLGALWSNVKDTGVHCYSQMKPWSEVFDKNAFSKPNGFGEALGRIRKNIKYFKFNYLMVTFVTTALTMFRDPGSLFIMVALAAMWFYLLIVRKEPIAFNGRQLGQREQTLAAGAVSVLVVFFFSSVGSELMYAMFLSAAIVSLHGAYRSPDELFLDDDMEAATLIPQSTSTSLQAAMHQMAASVSGSTPATVSA